MKCSPGSTSHFSWFDFCFVLKRNKCKIACGQGLFDKYSDCKFKKRLACIFPIYKYLYTSGCRWYLLIMSPNEEHSESCLKEIIVLNKQVFGLIRQVIFRNAKCIWDIWTTLTFLFTEDFVQDLVKPCFPNFTYLELLPFVQIMMIARFICLPSIAM